MLFILRDRVEPRHVIRYVAISLVVPVDARAIDGATALLVAAASGHVDTLRLLIERGATVKLADDYGDTALMAAVRAGSIESVKLLLAAGADANARDKAGRSALAWAVRSRRPDVMAALRAKGARGDETEPPRAPLTPRAAVERGLPLIQRGTATWNQQQSCSACHHHPLMFRATAIAQKQGFAVDARQLEPQVRAAPWRGSTRTCNNTGPRDCRRRPALESSQRRHQLRQCVVSFEFRRRRAALAGAGNRGTAAGENAAS
jgi:Ankyrin repeats (3 copies)